MAGPNLLPLAVNTTRSLRSVSAPDRYLGQVDFLADLVQVTDNSSAATKQAATFTVVAGLADASCYSFLANGRYLRHRMFRLRLEVDESSNLFRNDATFCVGSGSAGGSIALESKNYPTYYIHQRDGQLWLDKTDDTAAFRADSSFYSVSPWG